MSDALKAATYEKDAVVIQQGDEGGSDFYILEEGSLIALKERDGEVQVRCLFTRAYFSLRPRLMQPGATLASCLY